MPGYVYFIQVNRNGPIKIGYSRNVLRRLAELQIYNPYPLRIIGVIECSPEHELGIQRRFAFLRISGEWFRPADVLLEWIEKETRQGATWRVSEAS